MIDKELQDEILKSIALQGTAEHSRASVHIVLGSRNNLNHIAGHHSGPLRIYPSISKKFVLTLSQPRILQALNPFEIRCVLCKHVISYPCWYYSIKYAVNHFHYFICFDKTSPGKPSTKCYRKDI